MQTYGELTNGSKPTSRDVLFLGRSGCGTAICHVTEVNKCPEQTSITTGREGREHAKIGREEKDWITALFNRQTEPRTMDMEAYGVNMLDAKIYFNLCSNPRGENTGANANTMVIKW